MLSPNVSGDFALVGPRSSLCSVGAAGAGLLVGADGKSLSPTTTNGATAKLWRARRRVE